MLTHSRKVAVITGAARGIASESAQHLLRQGFTLIVNYAKNDEEAEVLAARLRDSFPTVIALHAMSDTHA